MRSESHRYSLSVDSLVELLCEDGLYPVNLGSNRTRRHSRDFGNGLSFETFEIKKHDLLVQRSQFLNQHHQAIKRDAIFRCRVRIGCKGLGSFQTDTVTS